jgi:hypothetical protein
METGSWLPLTDYALNNGVSISTLRRKIKSNNVTYKMVEGRYLILDERQSPKASATSFVSTDEAPITTAPRFVKALRRRRPQLWAAVCAPLHSAH